MILFLLIVSIVFTVANTYFYVLPYWQAKRNLQATKLETATQKAVIASVVVEMFENNEWDGDPPTVVATPKNRSSLNL